MQADWAKQHQPDDKVFVQALCEQLKDLELDPEKEDIWAPNNLLRKYATPGPLQQPQLIAVFRASVYGILCDRNTQHQPTVATEPQTSLARRH